MEWSQLLSPNRIGRPTARDEWSRTAFDQDYDRIIFSHPFRKLQDKTQVHPLPEIDFVHTRLTHSLEVSSAGRSLGKKAGEIVLQRYPDLRNEYSVFDFGAIVSAAALAHDLGNPPFGHAGEDAISDFFRHHPSSALFEEQMSKECWQDLIQFEGNAQGFRILNKNLYGLKLTHATLGAFTKYPGPSLYPDRDRQRRSQKKYGYFQSERDQFMEVALSLGLQSAGENVFRRHPLAFLVEAADDICYTMIDLEDACILDLVPFNQALEFFANILGDSYDEAKLRSRVGKQQKIGTLRALAIGRLIDECTTVFLDLEPDFLTGSFDEALLEKTPSYPVVKEILKACFEKVYRSQKVVEIQAAGFEVLPGLLLEFTMAGWLFANDKLTHKYRNLFLLFPEETRHAIEQHKSNPYLVLREIVDFIAGMTDRYAITLYQRIKGFG